MPSPWKEALDAVPWQEAIDAVNKRLRPIKLVDCVRVVSIGYDTPNSILAELKLQPLYPDRVEVRGKRHKGL